MLSQTLKHHFEGIVWKIVTNEKQDFLAIEVRNTEERSTYFFVLNIEKSVFVAQNLSISEPWWVGIESVSEYFLYLHLYDTQMYAQHKDIICVSLSNKEKNFTLKNHSFLGLENDYLFTNYNKKNLKLNAQTGQLIEENPSKTTKHNDFSNQILKIQEEDSYFIKLQQFILNISNLKAVKLIEYLDYESYMIVSFYHENEDNLMQNILCVLNSENATILLKIVLDDNLSGVGTNSFCVLKNKLVFCENKNTITIYEL